MNESSESQQEHFDAIVVGSGFGGAVTACRLAQAGFRVLVIERGRRYGPQDFPALPDASSLLPDFRRWTWGADQGLWDILDLQEIISIQAAGYGGGSLIYANVHLRPPTKVFDHRWPAEYQDSQTLDRYYDLAAHMLEAAPIDSARGFLAGIPKSDQLLQAASKLGRKTEVFYPPLAIAYEDRTNLHGTPQKGCTSCGGCSTGCAETAKNTLDLTYLATAERWNARAITECEVLDLRRSAEGGGWTVECINHLTREPCHFTARNVFLCAGSVHSTRLLARAQKNDDALAKLPVGVGYFPGGDALGVVYDTAHPQHPSVGPTITTSAVHWHSDTSFFLIQDGGFARQLDRLIGVLRAPAWVGRNRLTERGQPGVPASPPPSRSAANGKPPAPGLPSPLDDVINAASEGDFAGALSKTLRGHLEGFLRELAKPLLLESIVERTIDGAIKGRYKRWKLTRSLKVDEFPLRALVRFEKWLVGRFYGKGPLTENAIDGLVSFGGLSAAQWAARVLGYDAGGAENRAMLLAMGRDAASGVLLYDHEKGTLIADLDLFHLAPGYARQELLMSDLAGKLGGELRTNPAWAFLGKPVTVHNQGGCPMADDPRDGVTRPDGKVHGCDGLYVLDGSILCTSVGVNPSATIAAIAERNVRTFICEAKGNDEWPLGDTSAGALEYAKHVAGAKAWRETADKADWDLRPPGTPEGAKFKSTALGLTFRERMDGYYAVTDVDPKKDDAKYRALETKGRPELAVKLELDMRCENLASFIEDYRHRMDVSGTVRLRVPGDATEDSYDVHGHADILVPRYKPYGVHESDTLRRTAHERLASRYTTVVGAPPQGEQRFFRYELWLDKRPEWRLKGYKRVRDDPGLEAWRDTSTLYVKLLGPAKSGVATNGSGHGGVVHGAGVVRVELFDFLFRQLPSMAVTGTSDPARTTWALATFTTFFFGSLQRVYSPNTGSLVDALFRKNASNVTTEPHRKPFLPGSPP